MVGPSLLILTPCVGYFRKGNWSGARDDGEGEAPAEPRLSNGSSVAGERREGEALAEPRFPNAAVFEARSFSWRDSDCFAITTTLHPEEAGSVGASPSRITAQWEPRPPDLRLGGSLALPICGAAGASPSRFTARREPRPPPISG